MRSFLNFWRTHFENAFSKRQFPTRSTLTLAAYTEAPKTISPYTSLNGTANFHHLNLIVSYGAVPVIVPRVNDVHMLAKMDEIRTLHSSDTAIDQEKDTIEMRLAKLCMERNIPYLGICRGSQVLNVACGGTLYQDVERELTRSRAPNERVVHVNYDDYDGHRHPMRILEKTPLHEWFEETEIMVNSYHHQGVKRLAQRFVPMAFASDGLVEGFYDPYAYNPDEGKFIMGLQFHPERMRKLG